MITAIGLAMAFGLSPLAAEFVHLPALAHEVLPRALVEAPEIPTIGEFGERCARGGRAGRCGRGAAGSSAPARANNVVTERSIVHCVDHMPARRQWSPLLVARNLGLPESPPYNYSNYSKLSWLMEATRSSASRKTRIVPKTPS